MTNDGGPAFPLAGTHSGPESSGMTLRDYFAATAMQGMLAYPNGGNPKPDVIAEWAYEQADAMLKERDEE